MDFRVNFPTEMLDLMKLIMKNEHEIYLVGGCVRDMVMGREPHDFDMCTDADPTDLVELLEKHNIVINPKGLLFGTVTAVIGENEYEITTYREDLGYEDSRHPKDVSFVKDIKTDLSRRDFTINAIAFNPITKELVDPFNGKEDIQNAIIRTVRNPQDRFNEDALRILRGLRFAITLDFDIEQDTFRAMLESKKLIKYVSKERVTEEFRKIFRSGKSITKWFTQGADIIFELIPELRPCFEFNQNSMYHKHNVYDHLLAVIDACQTTKFEIKMAALLHDIGKPECYVEDAYGRGHFYGHPKVSYDISMQVFDLDLRLTREESKRIGDLVLYHDINLVPTDKAIKRAINKYGIEFLEDWFILHQADVDDHIIPDLDNPPDWTKVGEMKIIYTKIMDEQSYFSIHDLVLKGNDIKDILQIKGSPIIGEILRYLVDGVIDQKFDNTKESLQKAVVEFYASRQSAN